MVGSCDAHQLADVSEAGQYSEMLYLTNRLVKSNQSVRSNTARPLEKPNVVTEDVFSFLDTDKRCQEVLLRHKYNI